MLKFSSILLVTLLTIQSLYSQQAVHPNWCGSIEAMEANFKKHPELKQQFDVYQAAANLQQNNPSLQKTATVSYTIPVVFHILHQFGIENISDAQIEDQIRILNRDFNLLNADTSVIIAPFKNVKASVNFTFVLAKLDPDGNCTNGIDRVFDIKTLNWEGNFGDYTYTWDPTRYLNFYVVKTIESGAAGYAYYPGSLFTGSNMDAILILSSYVGSIGTSSATKSRAVTHEVGHWFNLQHTWGNTNDPGVACGDDQVGDTPDTKGFTACSSLAASQICMPGVPENYQNYMDYSYCSVMFTNGQAIRMNNAANSAVAGRNKLGSAANLTFTGINPLFACAPVAQFKANKQVICSGQVITYTDQSTIGTPTSWLWSFEGGSPSTSSVQNPTVTYNSPGTYSVQLVATNSAGSSTPEIKTGYITVLAPSTSTDLVEGFETGTIPNAKWAVTNISMANTNWIETSSAAATGSKSLFVPQTISPSSTADLFSQAYDLSAMPNASLTFKWAGAERDAVNTSNDVFSVNLSINCGLTWVPRLIKQIKSTTPGVSIVNGNFQPNSSQFNQETISLSTYSTATNVLFRFRLVSETGSSNNFYMDDINLSSSVATGLIDQSNILANLSVYPNPATENIAVSFDLVETKNIEITLIDVLGKTIKTINKQNLNSGHYELPLNIADVSKGIYFIKANVNDVITIEKIIIN